MDELDHQEQESRDSTALNWLDDQGRDLPEASTARRLSGRAEFWLIFTAIMSGAVLAYGAVFWLIRRIILALW